MTIRVPFDRAWRTTPERESLVAVAVPLKRDGKGTALTLKHDQFFDEAARDRHGRGWNETLDKLEADAGRLTSARRGGDVRAQLSPASPW